MSTCGRAGSWSTRATSACGWRACAGPPGCAARRWPPLAGVSADYYLRLEQGRDRHPSAAVLTALARVYGLDETAAGYLLSLAGDQPARARRTRVRPEPCRPASASCWRRALYPDWPKVTAGVVGAFRASIGTDTDDPRTVQLVGELSLAGEEFRRIWARHDVRALAGGTAVINHPEAGER